MLWQAAEVKRKMEAPNQFLWGRMKGSKDFFSCSQGEVDGENANVLNHSSIPTH